MLIETQELPPIGTNAIALVDEGRKECVIIDAPAQAYEWASGLAAEHDCKIVALILTHGHWDHILDAHKFAGSGIPVYGHRDDRPMFEAPSRMASFAIPGVDLLPVAIDHWLEHGQGLDLLGRQMEIRHVPGHCPGNILVYLSDEAAAVVGDVIFAGSVGRFDLPGADGQVLERSIKEQVYTLPAGTTIYPGHGPTTTVSREMATNPFVRA